MDIHDKDFMLDTLVSLEITKYCLTSVFAKTPDVSVQETMLISVLIELGCTIEEVDNAIRDKDFTNMLTDYGSGKRERGFVMDWIKEVWNTCDSYKDCMKKFGEY